MPLLPSSSRDEVWGDATHDLATSLVPELTYFAFVVYNVVFGSFRFVVRFRFTVSVLLALFFVCSI